MNLESIFPDGLYVVHALDLLGPVAVYVLGISVYAVFIFRFYRFVASRDMFGLDLSRYEASRHRSIRRILGVVMYVTKYLIVFPLFAFFWFAVLTLILTFLAKDRVFEDTLLIALATVSTIRVTAYYDEDLSRDLAKILPFAVLAIFLIDASFFEIGESLSILERANEHRETILYYLLFLVLLEFALRFLRAVLRRVFRRRKPAPAASEAPRSEPTPGPAPGDGPTSAADGDGVGTA
ncbi:MAG: hypothetical protein OXL97_05230 [Chloroflexota bacterium]|nr:hypothetical protein [Chloroflexota bacterium]MDE2884019.1 hypothetical protein [Chloroflexota bacterium]